MKILEKPVGIFYWVATHLTNLLNINRGASPISEYYGCNMLTLPEYMASFN